MSFESLSPAGRYQLVLVSFLSIFVGLLALPYVLLEPGSAATRGAGTLSAPLAPLPSSGSPADQNALSPDDPVVATPDVTIGREDESGRALGAASQGSDGTAASSQVPLTASDVGVTSDEIRLGILIFTLGTASDLGVNLPGLSPQEQVEAWETYVTEVNEGGGVLGRSIKPVYREYDPLDADSLRAACVFMGEDADVFAVAAFAGYAGDDAMCLTQRYGLPFVVRDGARREDYVRAGGNLISSAEMAHEDSLENLIWYLDAVGELDRRTVGVIAFEGDETLIEQSVVARLAAAGQDVVHISYFSTNQSAAASQAPLEATQMRAKDVDAVVVATEFITTSLFTQEAEAQGFLPRYWISDFQTMVGGTQGQIQGSRSWANMLGLTAFREGEAAVGLPTPAFDQSCEDRFADVTGAPPDRSGDHRTTVLTICSHVSIFTQAASAAGPHLTRAGWRSAITSIGELPVAGIGPSSFRPGKLSAPDAIRPVTWGSDCTCIVPAGEFVRPPARQ